MISSFPYINPSPPLSLLSLSLSSIDPDLRTVIYPAAIAKGGEEEWNFLWDRYLTIGDPYEKYLCLYALGDTEEMWLLSRYVRHPACHRGRGNMP